MSQFDSKVAVIIEDDSTSIKVLEQLLKQLGIRASVLRDGVDMREELAQISPPDIIFLDLEMPTLSGYMVLDLIRDIEQLKEIPVVAYTTHISHLNDTKRAGFHSFLGKPLDNRAFANQVAKILNGESVWDITG
jgi:two-component system, cell cycle response regulator DivK